MQFVVVVFNDDNVVVLHTCIHTGLGDITGNPFWILVRNIISAPSQEQTDCHSPKPILLNTGDLNFPYPWQPRILPIQLLQVGQLVIAGVPAEFT